MIIIKGRICNQSNQPQLARVFADCTDRCFMYRNRFQKDLLRYVNFLLNSSGFKGFLYLGVKLPRDCFLIYLVFGKWSNPLIFLYVVNPSSILQYYHITYQVFNFVGIQNIPKLLVKSGMNLVTVTFVISQNIYYCIMWLIKLQLKLRYIGSSIMSVFPSCSV